MKNNIKVLPINDLVNIDYERLRYESFIEAVTLDLDRTILDQFEYNLPKERLELARELGRCGMKVAFASNAHKPARKDRVYSVVEQFSDGYGGKIPVVLPERVGGRAKPHPDMLLLALDLMGIENPSQVIHIGDQFRSDVVSAERAGFAAAVIMKPTGTDEDFWVKHIGRQIYEPYYMNKYLQGMNSVNDFPDYITDEDYVELSKYKNAAK